MNQRPKIKHGERQPTDAKMRWITCWDYLIRLLKPPHKNTSKSSYKKEPNENYRTIKYSHWFFFNLLDALNSRVQMTDDRISELEDRSIKFTQPEQQWENKLKVK